MDENVYINNQDFFGKDLIEGLSAYSEAEKEEVLSFFYILQNSNKSSLPSKKWESLYAKKQISKELEKKVITDILSAAQKYLNDYLKNRKRHPEEVADENVCILKGALWASGKLGKREDLESIIDIALCSFRTNKNKAPIWAKIGNTAVNALYLSDYSTNAYYLVEFIQRAKYKHAKKMAQKLVSQIAVDEEVSEDFLIDLCLPNKGFENGLKEVVLDKEHTLKISVSPNRKIEKEVINTATGKITKTVPSKLAKENSATYQVVTKYLAELPAAFRHISQYIENFYLTNRSWKISEWQDVFVKNTTVCIISSKLIWSYTSAQEDFEFIIGESGYLKNAKTPLNELPDEGIIKLWHPSMSSTNRVLSWRKLISETEIHQPFKQAFREVYFLTEAEENTRNHSNRFAANILKQNQFSALARVRGWKYSIMGEWFFFNNPRISIPKYNLEAEFWLDANWEGELDEKGIYKYVSTDQVRFIKNEKLLDLEEVPVIVFSEIMRDVDLFVGVCSIGNDPTWGTQPDMDHQDYWQSFSFGQLNESAKIRREMLIDLLPKLVIANRCKLIGNFLHVKGTLRTYKIHIGSSNILMEPNDQYLCIVPDRSEFKKESQINLPFEGDVMLSLIISKAMMLAFDNLIQETSIVSQIKRN